MLAFFITEVNAFYPQVVRHTSRCYVTLLLNLTRRIPADHLSPLTTGSQLFGQPLAVDTADLLPGSVGARVEDHGALLSVALPRDVPSLRPVTRVWDVAQAGD